MQKYYQVQDRCQPSAAAQETADLDPLWLDLKNSLSPEMIGCHNKDHLIHYALQVARKVKKHYGFADWAFQIANMAYPDEEISTDQMKLAQVTQKIEKYRNDLKRTQDLIDEYLRAYPGDQPDDAVKRD